MAKDVYAAPIVFVLGHNILYYYNNNIDRQRAVRPTVVAQQRQTRVRKNTTFRQRDRCFSGVLLLLLL